MNSGEKAKMVSLFGKGKENYPGNHSEIMALKKPSARYSSVCTSLASEARVVNSI